MSEHRNILLVEDEAFIAMLEKQQLEKYGYSVLHVDNGIEAIELIKTNKFNFHLILMDIDLGKGLDGTLIAAKILEIQEIPIVFLSSHVEPEIVKKTERISSYGYVVKNSGIVVLDASIKMAFRLFEAKKKNYEQNKKLQITNNKLRDTIKDLASSNEKLNEMNKKMVFTNKELEDSKEKLLIKERALELSEQLLSNKLDLILNPHRRIEEYSICLNELLDIEAIKKILESFTKISGMGTALLDIDGNVLIATGWQDICTEFHRKHTITAENCAKSDLYLSSNLKRGEIVDYRCLNGLWDVGTPLYIGGKHLGNIFTGQFFYEGDTIDKKQFVERARLCGFDEKKYLDALYRVPFYSKESIRELMHFLTNFFSMAARLSYANLLIANEAEKNRRTQKELLESETRFKALHNASFSGLVIHDKGKIIDCNEELCKITGYKRDELIGMNDILLIAPEFHSLVLDSISKNEEEPYEAKGIRKNGEQFFVRLESRMIPYKGEKVRISELRDISEQKRIEKMSRLNEERLILANKATNDVIWDWDVINDTQQWNESGTRVFGWTEIVQGPVSAHWWVERVHPDDLKRVENKFFQAVYDSSVYSWQDEYRFLKADGSYADVSDRGYILRNDNGNAYRMVGAMLDVTKAKKEKEEIKRQLEEKEILLKEVHHRMKNNIASIEGMLYLQSESCDNDKVKEILKESISRVHSIRSLYENLLLNDEYQKIFIKDYIEGIIESLFSAYFEDKKIIVKKKITNFYIRPKQAISVGIIINELITNVLKYAFIDRNEGTIFLKLENNDSLVKLVIQDDGIGIKEDNNKEINSGFGLSIVKILTEQLKGKFAIKKDNGTRCLLEFKMNNELSDNIHVRN